MEAELPQNVKQLMDFGIDKEKAQYAYKHVKNNQNIDNLLQYIEENEKKIEQAIANPDQEQNQQLGQGESMEEEKIGEEQDRQPISGYVNQQFVKKLMEKGHSRNVSEKSLFYTLDEQNIDAAEDWINENKDQPDFEQQEFIIEKGIMRSNLTPAEAKVKLKEMLEAKKIQREEQEAVDVLDREKNRLVRDKQMRDMQEQLKEAQQARDVEQKVKDRQKFQDDKKKMQEKLDQDYIERFGMEKFKVWKSKQQQVKEKGPSEKFEDCVKAIITASPKNIFPGKAETALKMIKLYLDAIIKDSVTEKFRKINSQNQAFKNRVGDCFSGQATLVAAGFYLGRDGFLFMEFPNVPFLQQCSAIIAKHQALI